MTQSKEKKDNWKGKKQKFETEGRLPPISLEMERAVICAALIDPTAFARIADLVDETDFYDRRHGLIFEAMAKLFTKSSPIDALMVSEELESTKNLEAAGGDVYLAELSNEVATGVNAEYWAKVVRDKSALRRLIESATGVILDSYEAPDATEIIDRTLAELFEIHSRGQTGGFQSMDKILNITHAYLDKFHESSGELTGVGTGFPDLDEYTSGFQPGDLVVVGARPSMGKTAFSLDLALNACIQHSIPVAFFSLEMASMAIAMRLLASHARLNLHKLRSGKLSENDWQNLSIATGSLAESKLFIDDTGTLGLMEIRARARQLKQQHDIGLIFIDYLQLMKPPKANSREQEIAQISRGLKGLARELNVPVIALSQLSRAVEQRGGDKRPQLSDLRDSGAIEQDADVVMFIYRELHYKDADDEDSDPVDNTAEIIIRKQRNGPTGTVKLTFVSEYAKFESQAHPAAAAAAEAYGTDFTDSGADAPF